MSKKDQALLTLRRVEDYLEFLRETGSLTREEAKLAKADLERAIELLKQ